MTLHVYLPFETFYRLLTGNLLAGFATFTPKYIEAQFSLQSSAAAQFVGMYPV